MSIPLNISASRGSSILGLSKWSTPVNVWLSIMEQREPGFCEKHNYECPVFDEDTALFRWGHAFESAIIELAESKNNSKIIDREHLFEKDFITCHIDGNYFNPGGDHIGLHEGKTTSAFYFRDNFGIPGTDQVPIDYQIQCQHQMICTGAEKVILSVLVFPKRVDDWEEMGIEIELLDKDFALYRMNNPDKNIKNPYNINLWAQILDQMGYFYQYEINAHKELQELMIKHYTDFWNNHVLTGIAPEPKTYDDIKKLVREPVGTIVATPEIENLMAEYKNIKSEISSTGELAKRAEMIKVEILKYMRDHEKIDDDDSQDKFILRDQAGKKIASYGKTKKGYMFR